MTSHASAIGRKIDAANAWASIASRPPNKRPSALTPGRGTCLNACLCWCYALPPRRHRDRAHVLGHLVALLHSRPRSDGLVPALDVGILLHVDGLPLEARDPRPDRDVGNRVIVGDEFAAFEARVEHLIEPVSFLEIAFLGVGRLALVVFHEVMHLAEHRTGAAHLP